MADLHTWKNIDHACIISNPGNTLEYLTGGWRSMRPEIDEEKCVRCGKCWMFCPEAALVVGEDWRYTVNYDYCKGCGVCARECPYHAIKMVEECE